jgi:hypothetical protein
MAQRERKEKRHRYKRDKKKGDCEQGISIIRKSLTVEFQGAFPHQYYKTELMNLNTFRKIEHKYY